MSTAAAADSAIPAPRSSPPKRRTLYRGDPGMWSWVLHRITGVLIFFLNVPLAESAGRWLSAALAVALTIWFVMWRRTAWLAEDAQMV